MVMPFNQMSKEDVQRAEAMKQMAASITGEVLIDIPNNTISLKLHAPPNDVDAAKIVAGLMEQFPKQLTAQLQMFFGIKGVIRRKKQ